MVIKEDKKNIVTQTADNRIVPGIVYERRFTPEVSAGITPGIEYFECLDGVDLTTKEGIEQWIKHNRSFPQDSPHYQSAQQQLLILESAKERYNETTEEVDTCGQANEGKQVIECAPKIVRAQDANVCVVSDKADKVNAIKIAKQLFEQERFKIFDGIVHVYDGIAYRDSLDQEEFRKYIYNAAYKEIEDSGNPDIVQKVIKALEYRQDIPEEKRSSTLIAFNDWDYDFVSGRILPHSPENNTVARLNLFLRDKAFGTRRFDNHLANLWNSGEMTTRAYEVIGFLLAPGIAERKFVFMSGPAGTGKSSLALFIQSFFPTNALSATPVDEFGRKFYAATFLGKQLNIEGDFPNHVLSPTAVAQLKQLTGGDEMFVERKYKNPIRTRLFVKLLMCSNYPIKIAEDDSAFRERILALPITKQLKNYERNYDFYDQFREERAAIAIKALQHFNLARARKMVFSGEGLLKNYLNEIVKIEKATHDYDDYVDLFAENELIITGTTEDYVISAELAERFNQYVLQFEIFDKICQTARVSALFKKHYSLTLDSKRIDGKTTRIICGIRFKDDSST